MLQLMNKVFLTGITLIILYFLFLQIKKWYSSIYIKSNIDNRYYLVRNVNKEYNQQAADTLAIINGNNQKLINYLKSIDNGEYQTNINILIYRYNTETLMENVLQHDTSFTINKGEKVEFCLHDRKNENNKIHDINTLTYVNLHELSHIASITNGHNTEFKRNFAYLLKRAIEIDIYKYIDYSKNSIEYCGMEIKNSIL